MPSEVECRYPPTGQDLGILSEPGRRAETGPLTLPVPAVNSYRSIFGISEVFAHAKRERERKIEEIRSATRSNGKHLHEARLFLGRSEGINGHLERVSTRTSHEEAEPRKKITVGLAGIGARSRVSVAASRDGRRVTRARIAVAGAIMTIIAVAVVAGTTAVVAATASIAVAVVAAAVPIDAAVAIIALAAVIAVIAVITAIAAVVAVVTTVPAIVSAIIPAIVATVVAAVIAVATMAAAIRIVTAVATIAVSATAAIIVAATGVWERSAQRVDKGIIIGEGRGGGYSHHALGDQSICQAWGCEGGCGAPSRYEGYGLQQPRRTSLPSQHRPAPG